MTFWRLGAACLLSCAALLTGPAQGHAVIKQSVPANGAVVAAPREVTITFNEKLEKLFTSATLHHAGGAVVTTPKATLDPANPSVLRLAAPALKPGRYVVKWTAVGRDGHRLAGKIDFTVR